MTKEEFLDTLRKAAPHYKWRVLANGSIVTSDVYQFTPWEVVDGYITDRVPVTMVYTYFGEKYDVCGPVMQSIMYACNSTRLRPALRARILNALGVTA